MKKQSRSRWIAFIAEAVGGGIAGAVIAVPLALLLGALVPSSGGGFQDIVASLFGFAIADFIGVTLGVTLTGRYLMYHYGAWWMALIGAVIGGILTFAAVPLGLANVTNLFPIVFVIFTAILGAAAYAWSASGTK